MVKVGDKVKILGHLRNGCYDAIGLVGTIMDNNIYYNNITKGLIPYFHKDEHIFTVKVDNTYWGINGDANLEVLNDKLIFLDMDGCIWNTIKAICELYDEDFKYYKKYEKVNWCDIETWDFVELKAATPEYINSYFNQKRFFDRVEFMDNAKEVLDYLLSNQYKIKFVSSGFSPNLRGKEIWIKEHFPEAEFVPVNLKEYTDKSHIDMSGGIFIDDSYHNLITSNASMKICFGDKYEWNNKWSGVRCANWIETLEKIKTWRNEMNNDVINRIIRLDNTDKIKIFCTEAQYLDSDVFVKSKDYKYVVDGKSLMGIFSLNLTNDLVLNINTRPEETIAVENFLDTIQDAGIVIEE